MSTLRILAYYILAINYLESERREKAKGEANRTKMFFKVK